MKNQVCAKSSSSLQESNNYSFQTVLQMIAMHFIVYGSNSIIIWGERSGAGIGDGRAWTFLHNCNSNPNQ